MTERFEATIAEAIEKVRRMDESARICAGRDAIAAIRAFFSGKGIKGGRAEKYLFFYFWALAGADRSFSESEYAFLKQAADIPYEYDDSLEKMRDANEFVTSDDDYDDVIEGLHKQRYKECMLLAVLVVSADKEITYTEKARLFALLGEE